MEIGKTCQLDNSVDVGARVILKVTIAVLQVADN
jgi:hypothetical protein